MSSLSLLPSFLLTLLLLDPIHAADPPSKPCTIHSPSTGSYYDLRSLDLSLSHLARSDPPRTTSYHAKGYDYPSNFTLNICGPVLEPLRNIPGIPESRWANVSAFYTDAADHNKNYSIGQANDGLVFRGRSLVLNYTDGSPCPDVDEHGNILQQRAIIGGDDDDKKDGDKKGDDDNNKDSKNPHNKRRKSTLFSLHCDRDPSLSAHPSISFLGTLDHCTYMFEARSRSFCGGTVSSSQPGSLGPGSVFVVVLLVALLAYLVGGCAYQRVVMRQRGWRQCPNWGVWNAIWGFISDMTTILLSIGSSLFRSRPSSSNSNSNSSNSFLPSFNRAFNAQSRAGYHRVGENDRQQSGGGGGGGRGANTNSIGRGRGTSLEEDENRLIDQLDEEWED